MNGALCYWTIIKNSSASAFGGHSITDQKRKGQFFFPIVIADGSSKLSCI